MLGKRKGIIRMSYIIGIDQSTQGTKALLIDEEGRIAGRADKKHAQLVNEKGWVSHDPEEIYENVLLAVQEVMTRKHVAREDIIAIGISNQRETTVIWDKAGNPIDNAVVWQCARAKEITDGMGQYADIVEEKTGLPLSPYFPAGKMAWLLRRHDPGEYLLGTMDSWLVYKLTDGKVFQTDYSNASRTQLFNIHTLEWDQELCDIFGIPMEALPKVCDSNGCFGETTLGGCFPHPIPIYGVMGDSHAALFAQGCHREGMLKATYGTGSSIMMNIGEQYKKSNHGLATSLAWGIDGKVNYVLEGNINYTGAVITWLVEELKLIDSVSELEPLLQKANAEDGTILVPAFTGLSAPHWDTKAKALFYGMSRTTGQAEIAKAAVESIAFQIMDVVHAMEQDSGIPIKELNVDGGPTRNSYLMQFQSDMTGAAVRRPDMEEFSALGAAYMAGVKAGFYKMENLFAHREMKVYDSHMDEAVRRQKQENWSQAVALSRGMR